VAGGDGQQEARRLGSSRGPAAVAGAGHTGAHLSRDSGDPWGTGRWGRDGHFDDGYVYIYIISYYIQIYLYIYTLYIYICIRIYTHHIYIYKL
jgi:hypothetical protein